MLLEVALRVPEVTNSSRNSSPLLSPEGISAQFEGTSVWAWAALVKTTNVEQDWYNEKSGHLYVPFFAD